MTQKEQKRAEARKYLYRNYGFRPSQKILIVIRSVSASGMTRRMQVWNDKLQNMTSLIADLCDLSENETGLKVQGCGMDMAFWLANHITHEMGWSKAKSLRGNGGNCIAWTVA